MTTPETQIRFDHDQAPIAGHRLDTTNIARSLFHGALLRLPNIDAEREAVVRSTMDPTHDVRSLEGLPDYRLTPDRFLSYHAEMGIIRNPLLRSAVGVPRTIGELNDRYVTAASMAGVVILHRHGFVTETMIDWPLSEEPYKEARELGVNAVLLPGTRDLAWESLESHVKDLENYATQECERAKYERTPEFRARQNAREVEERRQQRSQIETTVSDISAAARAAILSGDRPIAGSRDGGCTVESLNGDHYRIEPNGSRWQSYSAASDLQFMGPDDLLGMHPA